MKRITSSLILFVIMILMFILPEIETIANEPKELSSHEKENISVDLQNVELNEGVSKIIFSDCDVKKWKYGFTTENIYIKKTPQLDSDIICNCNFNDKILFYEYNKEWVCVFFNNNIGYIRSFYITTKECQFIEYDFPENNGFKSFMSYKSITSSKQYELQLLADISTYGIRQVNGRYTAAIGTAFNADVGTYFDLVLGNGEIIHCIVGDIKSEKHTKDDNITTSKNGCVIEFIVDIECLNDSVKQSGDISLCADEWDSPALKIKIYNKNILEEE